MIKSFKSRSLKRFWTGNQSQAIAATDRQKVKRILDYLDAAERPEALNLPGFGLHALKGGLRGFWSIKVRGNWRIIFKFEGQDVIDVDYLDYH